VNPFRHFKLLSPGQIVDLVDESDITGTGTTLCVLGQSHELPENYFEKLVSEKRVKSVRVTKDEKPLFRIIYQMVASSQVSVLLVQALQSGSANILLLGRALDKIAERERARVLIFSTARHALIEQAREWGAVPFQVWMKKTYQRDAGLNY
jgi:hypothetical protein